MEAVSKAFFRRSNPRYSFAPVGSEHGRQSVARPQILRLLRGNQADCALGDFEYTVRTIVEIRFQKFHCFSVQVQEQWKIIFKHPDYHLTVERRLTLEMISVIFNL